MKEYSFPEIWVEGEGYKGGRQGQEEEEGEGWRKEERERGREKMSKGSETDLSKNKDLSRGEKT